MRHKLKNLSAELNSLYMRLDMLPKKVIINQISKRLINNRELIINQIGAMRQKNKCCDLDQEEMGELLTQTFEISSMNRAVPITCTLPKVGLTFGV
jgi:predicted methyltransferase